MTATCPRCGCKVRTVVPAGGDGSGEVFVRHDTPDGDFCPGSRQDAP